MKIIKKDEFDTTFNEIKFGECFRTKGAENYFMKTSLVTTANMEFNSVNLYTGCFDYFIAEQKVVRVECELFVK